MTVVAVLIGVAAISLVVLFVLTLVREGFVGNVSAADMAAIADELKARQTSYDDVAEAAKKRASNSTLLADLGIVGQKGSLSQNDPNARAYATSLLSGLDSSSGAAVAAQQVPTTQTSLSSASASLLSDMPMRDALSQGHTYTGKRTRNGNPMPPPDESYDDDCADASAATASYDDEDIAVRVDKEPGSYPFPTGYEDKGCDKNCS
jgi:hypothetical protein